MNTNRLLAASALLALIAGFSPGCGEGTIVFPGDDDDDDLATVTFQGNIDDVSPVTSRDIVVFVYTIDDDSDRCPCPPDPSASLTGKAAVLASGETEFTLSGLRSGAFGVVFLLDNAGDNADGEINPGDPIAVLDDIDCELDDIPGKRTVTLDDVDIAFSSAAAGDCTGDSGNPPVAGRARADRITQQLTDDDRN
ncbi:MAG: hypothetical protein ABR538_07385 [Candidatus Binatia bacterium]